MNSPPQVYSRRKRIEHTLSITTSANSRQYAYTLQNRAGSILGDEWPVSWCGKRIRGGAPVAVKYNARTKRAYFHNLVMCKSAWTCPVCARRIMTGRAKEVESILRRAGERGYNAMLITATVSHHTGTKLKEQLDAILSAWRSVFSGERSGKRRALARVVAQVRRLEVRYGRNSWHGHVHALVIFDAKDLSEAERLDYEKQLGNCIYERYAKKIERLGYVTARDGYDAQPVSVSDAAARYLSKLDITAELTATDTKTSNVSYSMFQLLGLLESGEREVYGRSIEKLFIEYATATKGRRMVSYSRGIKELLGSEPSEDEQLANEDENEQEEDVTLVLIERPLWYVMVKRELRAALLEVADGGNAESVARWLAALEESMNST